MKTEQLSYTEENYLKAIFALTHDADNDASTNAIAKHLHTKPASVTDMLKKLSQKKLINYVKYKGVSLTDLGRNVALRIIRKHRLWEVFLVEKLSFHWDEVHEIAEQLEHIKSPLLIKRLDSFLGHPKFDPHGDPIPDEEGNFAPTLNKLLAECDTGDYGIIVGVQDSSPVFLQYLDKMNISLGSSVKIIEKVEFDGSLEIEVNQTNRIIISKQVADNLYISL